MRWAPTVPNVVWSLAYEMVFYLLLTALFLGGALCRNKKVPRAPAWLGLVSYSVYLLHPVLIEVYASVPWTRNENFQPMELPMVAVFVLVLLVCCG